MSVKLKTIVEKFNLEKIYLSKNYNEIIIDSSEVNRPGLQLCGYFNKFVVSRIQIIGTQEWCYLNELNPKERYQSLELLFQFDIPCIIFTRDNKVFDEAIQLGVLYGITVLKSKEPTAKITTKIISFIDEELAPSIRIHGVLLDVYGVGVLITGPSGIGKSETALDLISNGARLISDDSIIIKRIDERLMGRSPNITKYFMEIRGVGIIDVQKMFGIGYVMEEKKIELIANLEEWDQSKEYDRLGIQNHYENMLGIDIVKFDVPVKPGRHTALIIEVATKNFKQKELGYNPALALNDRIVAEIENRKNGE
ncbi:MAG: HPr(Ser) kinase/phosphatase [Tissierellia bacterium]|nr:HPr(Ser) kinase/phosphatase [Tissierellia bacterium]